MRTVAIIQARTGSSRLPRKIFCDLAGEPMLYRVVSRLTRAQAVNDIVVATTTLPADDSVETFCAKQEWQCFRGDENDLLDRYYRAAISNNAEVVVRITSDCPLIDPTIVDSLLGVFIAKQPLLQYASNIFPSRTYPRGLDVEVIRFDALRTAWEEDANAAWREHVTQFIQRSPGRFNHYCLQNDTDLSNMRWTVDTIEDLRLVQRIYNEFRDDSFSWHDVLEVMARYPEWSQINRHIQQKSI